MRIGFKFPHAEFVDKTNQKRIGLIFPFGDDLGLDKEHLPKTEAEIRRYIQENNLNEDGYLEFCMNHKFPIDCSGIAFLLDLELQLEKRSHLKDRKIILCNPEQTKRANINLYKVGSRFDYQKKCSENCPFYKLAQEIKGAQSPSITHFRQSRFSTS